MTIHVSEKLSLEHNLLIHSPRETRVDRYVHFSGPIFVYENHYKWPPEFSSLANIWGQSLACCLK